MRGPDVELLWWAGCPSTDRARANSNTRFGTSACAAVGLRRTEISTDEQARARDFVGSPTILIDGVDVASPGPDEPVVAVLPYLPPAATASVSPTPDPDDMRDALRRAASAPQEVDR